MRWALTIFISTGIQLMYAAPNKSYVTISTSACRIDIQWRITNYTEFFITIENVKDENFTFNLQTNAHSFTYTGKPGQTYRVQWAPIEGHGRGRSVSESIKDVKTATVLKDCDGLLATTSKAVKDSEFDCLPPSSNIPLRSEGTTDTRVDAVHSTSTISNDLFSYGFCNIYFWTSLLAIPLAVFVITTVIYLVIMRKSRGPVQNGNVSPQVRRINAKSTSYDNADVTNEYDEVHYSLAYNTDI